MVKCLSLSRLPLNILNGVGENQVFLVGGERGISHPIVHVTGENFLLYFTRFPVDKNHFLRRSGWAPATHFTHQDMILEQDGGGCPGWVAVDAAGSGKLFE